MRRSIRFELSFACLLIFAVAVSWAGQTGTDSGASQPQAVPAATFSDFQCTGFIADTPEPDAIRLYNGADNDLFEELHTFTPGDLVYLRSSGGQTFRAGEAFSLIRPDNGSHLSYKWRPSAIENQVQPFASNYKHQIRSIKELGFPYDNTGLVRVLRATPQGAIAQVEFACTAINAQDIAIPYIPQAIPEYAPDQTFDPYAPPDGKLQGTIVGANAAATFLARGSIAFLNIGQSEGVRPGQRYRIYVIFRHNVLIGLENHKQALDTPRESVGELVILHVQGKASEGIVIDSRREISVGDGVELE
ncbi:MAG: hypothetical protein ACRD19_12135 [Terriglobia bacterium]